MFLRAPKHFKVGKQIIFKHTNLNTYELLIPDISCFLFFTKIQNLGGLIRKYFFFLNLPEVLQNKTILQNKIFFTFIDWCYFCYNSI